MPMHTFSTLFLCYSIVKTLLQVFSQVLLDLKPSLCLNPRSESWQADEEARAKMAAGMQMQQALSGRVHGL